MTDQQMPNSTEAEQAVLGGLMMDNSALGYVLDAVSETDFYRRDHRSIFNAILKCDGAGNPFDTISLASELDTAKELDDIGGLQYLVSLSANTSSSYNIKSYARIIKERSLERRLAQSANEIMDLVHEPSLTPQEKIDSAGALLMELTDDKASTGPRKLSETLMQWVVDLDERFTNGGDLVGMSTGFTELDKITAGLQNSDLIIIAGRPAMGKTTLAMNIAENAALNEDVPVAVFSLEMPVGQLTNRMISSIGRIDHGAIRSGKVNDHWDNITLTTNRLNAAPIFIDDTPSLTSSELRNRARRLKQQEDIGLIVVDYLQLMQCPGTENRTNEIGAISRTLKAIAKELNVPVIALSQLSRGVDQRSNSRPIMSDLRESGSIEQDADVIAFVYRDEVYNEESHDKGTAEIIIRKQRNGDIGTVRLAFNGALSRFDNLAHYE